MTSGVKRLHSLDGLHARLRLVDGKNENKASFMLCLIQKKGNQELGKGRNLF
jgi:hypothetical protein